MTSVFRSTSGSFQRTEKVENPLYEPKTTEPVTEFPGRYKKLSSDKLNVFLGILKPEKDLIKKY